MVPETLLVLTLFGIGYYAFHLYSLKNKQDQLHQHKLSEFLNSKEDVYNILLAGMYQRFKKEEGKLVDTPYDFERFVAKTLEVLYKGKCTVTPSSNDGGVDILHYTNDGIELIQVKCYDPNAKLNFEPVAIIHSQMIKQQAQKAAIISTCSYSDFAIRYADEVNVRLIDGKAFLELWIQSISKLEDELLLCSPVTPDYA
ncbi:restriction endonuclease [Paenibacillus sp. ATY16]|uniref:restriction endonuclease n=1 Tax=Paenibacillus sp. ATY16 TaxID=1759312 RepID=UPI00200F8D27|nr:restriction endonuclease [Paenibacillus sp. ATY16]MCK9862828.1 restriction endonuclease [Paenibacillus sp. ATY16]